MARWVHAALIATFLTSGSAAALAQTQSAPGPAPISPTKDSAATLAADIPAKFTAPAPANADYVKKVEMIPMRDGVKLYTVIVIPKGARNAPIILTRTPYNAKSRAARTEGSASIYDTLPLADEDYIKHGYIRVYQDVRGKWGSEGEYVMTRPPIGPLNPTKVDHVTDAYDTIDWLVKNTPESNGKVGMIGSSYEGFTVVMALLNPHPALRAAVPESPMVDGWMGDDWFHYGAFRQPNFDYVVGQTTARGAGEHVHRAAYDDYDFFLKAGSAGDYARSQGIDQLGWNVKMMQHPAYDAFWQGQALDKLVAAHPSNVPTMWEQGLWDQEDMYGANHSFAALKAVGHEGNNWLVMGPWFHSQVNRPGDSLGDFKWDGDTAEQFRRDMTLPFFEEHLKGGPPANIARVNIYNTGENHWDKLNDWPTVANGSRKPLYLNANYSLSFISPAAGADSYVSDPAKPVPHIPRPARFADGAAWRTWLIRDQRFIDGRPDVLTYVTPKLTAPVKIAGVPTVDLTAMTTGTDGDFVVKLIDVYPDEYPNQPELGGYEQGISGDIFRARYRESFEHPIAMTPNKPFKVKFDLPNTNHVFQPGHRIMVMVMSSAFPLYDRNPQTFVPNIFNAKPADYQKATVTLERGPGASAIWLPVAP